VIKILHPLVKVESLLFLIGTGLGIQKKRDEGESKISVLSKWMYGAVFY